MHIFLYGPPGSGKTTLGSALAEVLDMPFIDLDRQIEAQRGKRIRQIFTEDGESVFRDIERRALRNACEQPPSVIALGGGALLDNPSRAVAETHGQVLLLEASPEALLARLGKAQTRPLLAEEPAERLRGLLAVRESHYASFPVRLDTTVGSLEELTRRAQVLLGAFRVRGMGQPYDARFRPGGLNQLGDYARARKLGGPVAVVSDSHIAPLYLKSVLAGLEEVGYRAAGFSIPAGEAHKTIATLQQIWNFLIDSEVERGSTVIALGGGVVGDLTGFAAATFLRGVAWVNVPTTLLAMVDASLGGKTAIDLPQAKNLVGAFYPPHLVLADPDLLQSLPEREIRGGLVEVVKHGIIGDLDLFEICESGWQPVIDNLERVARQAVAVKVRIIEDDPYEKNLRQVLNLGHTVGHGIELASDYRLSHGEAVAVGLVIEARMSEALGLAEVSLAERVASTLAGLGLPTTPPPGLTGERIVQAMRLDKKRSGGRPRFALPVRIGDVRPGIDIVDWQQAVLRELNPQRSEK